MDSAATVVQKGLLDSGLLVVAGMDYRFQGWLTSTAGTVGAEVFLLDTHSGKVLSNVLQLQVKAGVNSKCANQVNFTV